MIAVVLEQRGVGENASATLNTAGETDAQVLRLPSMVFRFGYIYGARVPGGDGLQSAAGNRNLVDSSHNDGDEYSIAIADNEFKADSSPWHR